jgi:hypothetical protein
MPSERKITKTVINISPVDPFGILCAHPFDKALRADHVAEPRAFSRDVTINAIHKNTFGHVHVINTTVYCVTAEIRTGVDDLFLHACFKYEIVRAPLAR